jgi:hypothetical protein
MLKDSAWRQLVLPASAVYHHWFDKKGTEQEK